MEKKKAPKKSPAKKAGAKRSKKSTPTVTVEAIGTSRNVAPAGFFAKILMPESPLTPETEPEVDEGGISFGISPEEYERTARNQRAYFSELADKLITDAPLEESLSLFDRVWAAGAIRAYASQIPLKKPGSRGQAPRLDPGKVAVEFALETVNKGVPKSVAIARLAEKWDVSDEAIRKALKKYGDRAVSMLSNLKQK